MTLVAAGCRQGSCWKTGGDGRTEKKRRWFPDRCESPDWSDTLRQHPNGPNFHFTLDGEETPANGPAPRSLRKPGVSLKTTRQQNETTVEVKLHVYNAQKPRPLL